jgi:hypothetical protein
MSCTCQMSTNNAYGRRDAAIGGKEGSCIIFYVGFLCSVILCMTLSCKKYSRPPTVIIQLYV